MAIIQRWFRTNMKIKIINNLISLRTNPADLSTPKS